MAGSLWVGLVGRAAPTIPIPLLFSSPMILIRRPTKPPDVTDSPRLSVVANGSYYGVIPVGFDAVGCTGKVVRVGFRVRVAGARV